MHFFGMPLAASAVWCSQKCIGACWGYPHLGAHHHAPTTRRQTRLQICAGQRQRLSLEIFFTKKGGSQSSRGSALQAKEGEDMAIMSL